MVGGEGFWLLCIGIMIMGKWGCLVNWCEILLNVFWKNYRFIEVKKIRFRKKKVSGMYDMCRSLFSVIKNVMMMIEIGIIFLMIIVSIKIRVVIYFCDVDFCLKLIFWWKCFFFFLVNIRFFLIYSIIIFMRVFFLNIKIIVYVVIVIIWWIRSGL